MTKENEITALGEFNKKFENTYELFKKNLENDEEVGASFAVYQNGEVLVISYPCWVYCSSLIYKLFLLSFKIIIQNSNL